MAIDHRPRKRRNSDRRRPRATGWLVALAAASAIANPQSPQVANGQATFQSNGGTLTITNSPGAIINWKSFGIDRGELTRFVQQNAASAVLNRVTGSDPSRILGALQSNGRVFLINPNGIVFGKGSQIDVGGLVMSSLRLSDQDFLAGRLRFTETPGAGEVRNEGSIRTSVGGQVILVAPRVENSGLIEAPEGKILLAAGRSVEISDIDRPSIRVEITNSDEEAVNIGTLISKHISIYGGLVRNSGTIQASTAVVGENGKVTLRGKQGVVLAPSSVIEAKGPQGGEVLVQSDGDTVVQGVISVRAELPVPAPTPAPALPASPGPALSGQTQLNTVVAPPKPATPVVEPTPGAAQAAPALAEPAAASVAALNAAPAPVENVPAPSAPILALAPVNSGSEVPATSSNLQTAPPPISGPLPRDPLVPSRPEPQTPALPVAPAGAPAGPSAPTPGNGVGGSIRILGRSVTVGEGAVLDASGPLGGGEILIGGGWQGLNPNIINSQITYLAASAQLFASADLRGNGGLVVVWANDSARVYGKIAARGGALGGNGGNIETSGKRMLEVTQAADASAANGKGGLWLLDPNNATLRNLGPNTSVNVTNGPPLTSISTTGDSAIIMISTIKMALDAGTNVTVTTSAGGAQLGDITLSDLITTTSATDVTLTLSGHNNININAGISATGTGKLNLVLNADSDATSGGASATNQTINLNGGTLTVQGGGLTLNNGASLQNATLVTNGGFSATLSTSAISTFTGVTLAGDVTVGNAAFLNIANGLVMNGGKVTLSTQGSGASLVLLGSGDQTISGSGGEIIFAGNTSYSNNVVKSSTGGTLVLGSNIVVHSGVGGNNGTVGSALLGLTNHGTINADAASRTITITGTNWSNDGTLQNSGGTLTLDGSWSSAATPNLIKAGTGTLNLDGTFAVGSITGNFQRTGGTVNLYGTLNLATGSYDLGASGNTGNLVLQNGSGIQNGTLSSSNGTNATLTTSAISTFTGVTLAGDVTVGNAAFLNIANGLVMNGGKVTLSTQGSGASLVLLGSGDQTISGSGGEIIFAGNTSYSNNVVKSSTGGTLVLGSNIVVHSGVGGNNGTVGSALLGLTNHGTINADAASRTITITGTNWSNDGTLQNSGGTLTLDGSWSSAATPNLIKAGTGTLNLDGTFAVGSITGNFQRTGGTVNLYGTLNLATGSYDLGASGNTGNLVLQNGSGIQNGTLSSSNGTNATLTTSAISTFTGVTLAGDVTVGNAAFLNIANGLVMNGGKVTLSTQGSGASLVLLGSGDQTISGSGGEIIFAGNTSYSNNVVKSSTGGTLVLGSNIVVHSGVGGNNGTVGSALLGLTNHGTINADAASRTITITGTNWSNDGTLQNSGGTLTLDGSWSSAATPNLIKAGTGTLNLDGTFAVGSITGNFQRTGGTVNLYGTLNLATGSYDLGASGNTGNLVLQNGSGIQNGTLSSSNGTNATLTTSAISTFTGVTLAGDVTVGNAAFLNIANGLVMNGGKVTLSTQGSGASLVLLGSGDQTISGSGGEIIFAGNTSYSNNVVKSSTGGTLVLGSNIVVHSGVGGNNGTVGSALLGLTNHGTINADAASRTITITGTNWSNDGTLQNSGGTLTLDGSWSSAATPNLIKAGTGTLNLDGTFAVGSITGNFQRTGGTVNLYGTLNLATGSYDLGASGNTGNLVLQNGSGIQNGTLSSSNGTNATLTTSAISTFTGVTLAGDVTVGNAAFLNIANGLVMNGGKVTLSTQGSGASLVLLGSGDQTISGSGGEIIFAGNTSYSNNVVKSSTGGTLVLGSNIVVHSGVGGNNGTVGSALLGLTNHGTINADAASRTITITGTNWTNDGSLLTNGGSIFFGGTIASNTGTITVAAGTTLDLSGTYTTGTLGTFIRGAGSIVNLTGTLDNSGSMLDIGSAGVFSTGGLNSLNNGTIIGGTIISSDATPVLNAVSNPFLNGVTLGSASYPNLTINGGIQVSNDPNLLNPASFGLLLADGAVINKGSGTWYFGGSGERRISVAGGAGASATLNSSGGVMYANYSNAVTQLTLGAGLTLAGSGSINDYYIATVVNNGTINANVAGQTFTITPTNFTNAGTLNATAGTTALSATTWNNTGALNVAGGTLNISGTNGSNSGSFNISSGTLNLGGNITTPLVSSFTRTGGTVNVTGTINNTNNVLDIGSAGLFGVGGLNSLNNGTIIGGTIISSDATPVLNAVSNPFLNGVTLGSASYPNLTINGGIQVSNDPNLLNPASFGLLLADGAVINKGSGTWYFGGSGERRISVAGGAGASATLNSSGGVMYANYSNAVTQLTLGAGLTLAGSGSINDYYIATVVNNGTINANVAGQTFTITPTNFTNAGTLNATAGTTALSATTWNNTGALNVAGGTLNISGTNGSNSGSFNISSGTLNLGGNITTPLVSSFTRTGGTVNVTGTINNTNNVLDIGSAGLFGVGGLNSLNNGTIIGGTIISSDATPVLNAVSNPFLNGVTLGSASYPNLTINGGIQVSNDPNLLNPASFGLLLADGAVINKGSGTWYFGGSGERRISVAGGAGASATLNSSGGVMYANYSNAVTQLTLGAGLTLAGSGSINDYYIATVVNNGTINANVAGQTFTITPTNFTNAGTLNATAGTTALSATTWNNTGALNVAGGTLNISGTNGSNSGSFNISSGTLNLGGNITTPLVSSFTRTGGTVNVTGTINNTNNVLDIGSAGLFGVGGLNSLNNGTIIGGTIISSDATPVLNAVSNPFLNGVTLGSASYPNLTINGGIQVSNDPNLLNPASFGLLLADGAVINKGSGTWYFGGSGERRISVAGGAGASATLNSSGGVMYANYSNAVTQLTLGAGLTLAGSGSINDYYIATVVNNGTINANVAGQTFTITPTNFTNAGTLNATAGTTALSATTWNNTGALNVAGGTLNISGTNGSNSGSFNISSGTLNLGGNITTPLVSSFTRTGGTVNVTGTINNTNNVLDIGSAGLFGVGGLNSLNNGTIIGGTIISSDATPVLNAVSNPFLNGVTLGSASYPNLTINGGIQVSNDPNLLNPASFGLLLADGAVINKGSGTWYFGGSGERRISVAGGAGASATLNSSGGVMYANYSNAVTQLTLGAGLTLAGSGSINDYYIATVVNNGTINANVAGQTFTITPTNFTNAGTLILTNGGTLGGGGSNWTNGLAGVIAGAGSINMGSTTINNDGVIRVGGLGIGSIGLLAVTGNLTQGTTGSLEFEVAGRSKGVSYDALTVSGTATLGGAIKVTHAGGFIPGSVEGFRLLGAATVAGNFSANNLPVGFGYSGITGSSSYVMGVGVAAINEWINPSNGVQNWSTTGNWSQGHAPTSTEFAVVDRSTLNPTVTINSAVGTIGLMDINETLTIAAGGSMTITGPVTGASASVLNLSGGSLTTSGQLLLQQVNLSGGVWTANADGQITRLVQTGGTLGGAGTLTLTGAGNTWSGTAGSWTGGGSVVVGNGIDLTLSGSGVGNVFAGRTLSILAGGTVNIAGSIELDPGVNAITNAGTLNLNSGDIRHTSGSQGSLTLTNNNIVNKNNANTFILGSSPVAEALNLTNSGTLNINAGTLDYAGGAGSSTGTAILLAGSTWRSSGGAAMSFGAGSTFTSAGNLVASGGTTSFQMPTANFTHSGSITNSGGGLSFTPDVNVPLISLSGGGFTTFIGNATTAGFTQTGGVLSGAGTLTLTGAGNSWSGTAGSWSGGGSVVIANGAALTLSGTGVGNVFAGRTLSILAGGTVNIAGSIELDPGVNAITNAGTLNLNSGDIRHTSGSQGSLTLANTNIVNKNNANTFILGSSPVAEALNLTNSGTFNINAGTLDYAGGTGSSAGAVNLLAGSTWRTSGNAAMSFGAGSTFASAGNLVASGGTTSFQMPTANFTHGGNITNSGGGLTFTPDVSVPLMSLSGGSTSFIGNASTPSFSQTGGTLSGAGTLTLTGAGNTWSGVAGSWSGGGSVVVANGAGLTLTGSGVGNVFAGRTLNILAGGTVNVAGSIELDPGVNAITNAGTLNLNSGDIRHTSGSQGSLTLANNNIINKNGAGIFTLGSSPPAEAVNLVNVGILNINAGRLDYAGGVLTQTGTIHVGGGSVIFSKPGGFTNDGLLTGSGTFDVTGGSLINAGTIPSPGTIRPDGGGADPTGTMSIVGDFTQTSTGVLDFQAEGSAAGMFDRLAVSGLATFGGTMAIAPASGFVPSAGQSYDLVTYGSGSGAFSTIVAPAFGGLAATYGTNAVTFGAAIGCAVDDCWIGTSGDWSTGANWSTGFAPTAGQKVKIDVAGLQTITVSAGPWDANQLTVEENVVISGGSLTLGGTAAFNQTLTVSGGIANFNAPSSINVLNLSSGTVNAAAALSASTYDQTGGNLTGGGTFTVGNVFSKLGGSMTGVGNTVLGAPISFNANGFSVDRNLTVNGATALTSGNTLSIAPGKTFTVNGGISIDASNADASVVGGGTLVIPAAVAATITGNNNNDVYFDNVTVNNAGLFNLSQPNVNHVTALNNGAVFNNQATGELRFTGVDNRLLTTSGSGTFNNAGLLRSGGENISLTVATANYTNASTVDAGAKTAYLYAGSNNYSGNLTFTGDVRTYAGVHNFADGTVVGGSGTLSQVGGTTVMNNVSMNKAYALTSGNTLSIAPGKTFTVNGGISIDASNADASVVGGGTLVIPAAVAATITGNNNNDVYFDNVTVNNAGLFNLSQPNVNHITALNNGAVFNNQATGELRFTGVDNRLLTTSGSGTFNNAGLLRSGGENISLTVATANYTNASTVDAGAKTAYLYAGSNNYSGNLTLTGDVRTYAGAHSFADGTVVGGSGALSQVGGSTVMNNVTMNKAYALTSGNTLSIAPGKTFTVNGGISIDASNADASVVGGGTLVIPAAVAATITGNNNNDVYFDNVTVNNAGLFNLSQPNVNHVTALNNGAVFNNQATGELRFTGVDNRLLTTSGSGTFNNAGLLRSGGENISLTVATANYTNASTVDAGAKTAYLYAGSNNYSGNLAFTGDVRTYAGAHNFADGTVVGGSGTLSQVGGTTVMNNVSMNKAYALTSGNTLSIATGKTFTVNGGISIDASNADASVVGGGTLVIPAAVAATITGNNNNDVYFDNVTVNNAGLFNLSQPNVNHVTALNNGAVFNNQATGELRFTGVDNRLLTTSGSGTFNNAGLLRSGGENISLTVATANYTNASTVDAGAKTAYLYAGSNNYSGNLTFTGDVRTYAGAHNFADGTVVGGSGTLSQVGGTTVMNNVSMNKAYALTSGNTLSIAPGKTFTVNGGISIDASNADASVVGGGTLVIPAAVAATITGNNNNDVYFDNVTVNNAGLFNLSQPNVNHITALNNGAVFNNQATGELRFTGVDNRLLTTSGSGTFNNAGLLRSGGENISLTVATANYTNASTVDAGAKTAYLYAGSNNYSGNVSFTGSAGSSVVLYSGTHNLNGTLSTSAGGSFGIAGGTVNLANGSVLNLGNDVNWSGGAINLTGTTTGATLSAGSMLTMTSQALGGTGKLTNAGTLVLNNSSIAGTLVNQGTLNVNSGSSSVNGAALDLAGGAINIAGGATLDKSGGAVNWGGGSINGAGSLTTSGGATFEFVGSGARVLNTPSLTPTSFDIVAGSLELQSGTLSIAGGNLAGGAALILSGGTLDNSSLLSIAGTLGLSTGSLTGGGVIDVTGAVNKTGPAPVSIANPLNNRGTVDVQAGSLVLAGGGTHSGVFMAVTGATIDFQGGTHNFADGAKFAGPGVFDGGGVLNITGAAAGLTFDADTMIDLNRLAFGGSGSLTNFGSANASNISLPGDFFNEVGATANLTDVTIGGSLDNLGTFNADGVITVAGAEIRQLGGVINVPVKATLLDMSSPSGVFSWVDGTIAGTGTLGFSGGGTFLFAGTGDRVIDGLNFSFNNLTLPDGSLTLQSGSLTLNGATVLPALVALNLNGGTLNNNGTLDVGGTFNLTGGAFGGGGSLSMSGGSLSLPANNTVAWTNSGTLTNTGTLNLASSTITNAIDNLGTINLGGGLVFTQPVTNNGTVDAQAGMAVFNAGLNQNANGNIVLTGGSLQGNLNLNAGSLSGRGTVDGNVAIGNATLTPGFSPGSITITGNLDLAPSSVLTIELAGLTRGSGYDWINVLGTANLGGVLNVSNIGGFVPPSGSSFTFMNFSATNGAFSAINLPPGSGLSFGSSINALSLSMPGAFPVAVPILATVPAILTNPSVIALQRAMTGEELFTSLGIVLQRYDSKVVSDIAVEGCQ